jgi:hypothetical protein
VFRRRVPVPQPVRRALNPIVLTADTYTSVLPCPAHQPAEATLTCPAIRAYLIEDAAPRRPMPAVWAAVGATTAFPLWHLEACEPGMHHAELIQGQRRPAKIPITPGGPISWSVFPALLISRFRLPASGYRR